MFYIPEQVTNEKVEEAIATYLAGIADFYRNK